MSCCIDRTIIVIIMYICGRPAVVRYASCAWALTLTRKVSLLTSHVLELGKLELGVLYIAEWTKVEGRRFTTMWLCFLSMSIFNYACWLPILMIYVDFLVCRGKSGRKKLLWTNCYSLATLPLPGIQICKHWLLRTPRLPSSPGKNLAVSLSLWFYL